MPSLPPARGVGGGEEGVGGVVVWVKLEAVVEAVVEASRLDQIQLGALGALGALGERARR